MSSNRPSLADAFAPVAPTSPRGVRLEGLLPPKRKRAEEKSETRTTTEPIDPQIGTPGALSEGAPDGAELAPAAAPVAAPKPEDVQGLIALQDQVTEQGSASAPEAEPKRRTPKKPADARPKASATVPGAPRNVGVYLAPQLLADVKDAVYRRRTTYADLLIDAFEALESTRIAREFEFEPTMTNSGMPRRSVRPRGSAGIQIQVRLDDTQIAWLDQKVKDFDAPSRSALVSTVYKLYLSQESGVSGLPE